MAQQDESLSRKAPLKGTPEKIALVVRPKAQPFPASKIKVGAVLYVASAYTDENRKTTSEIEEWVVRSIKAKRGSKSSFGVASLGAKDAPQYVNLTKKLEYVTWGKRSTKTGDSGWLKSIPTWCVKQFLVGDSLPVGVYTTPRAALVYAITDTEISIDRSRAYMAEETDPIGLTEWQQEIADSEAQLIVLKRRLAKLRK